MESYDAPEIIDELPAEIQDELRGSRAIKSADVLAEPGSPKHTAIVTREISKQGLGPERTVGALEYAAAQGVPLDMRHIRRLVFGQNHDGDGSAAESEKLIAETTERRLSPAFKIAIKRERLKRRQQSSGIARRYHPQPIQTEFPPEPKRPHHGR